MRGWGVGGWHRRRLSFDAIFLCGVFVFRFHMMVCTFTRSHQSKSLVLQEGGFSFSKVVPSSGESSSNNVEKKFRTTCQPLLDGMSMVSS